MVKTVKWLLSKCSETYRGFGLKSSPELLWKEVSNSVANDRNPTCDTRADARHSKESGRNRHSTTIGRLTIFPHFELEKVVRMQLPGEKRWTSGICTGLHGPRSYGIRVGEAEYCRNRRHILKGGEMSTTEQAEKLYQNKERFLLVYLRRLFATTVN